MNKEIIGFIISYAYVFLLLLVGKVLSKYGEEISRKFVHIMTANWWFIVMLFFKEALYPLIIAGSFLVVNIITYKYHIFTCIERSKEKDRGTIYYAIALVVLVSLSFYYKDMSIGLIGILIMGYGDGLAALIGKKLNWLPYHIGGYQKSISGNITMFLVSFVILWIVYKVKSSENNIIKCNIIALSAMILEIISIKGLDNLTVPIGAVIFYLILGK